MIVSILLGVAASAPAEPADRPLRPEPAPIPFEQRQTPYGMVYYYLSPDESFTRWCLGSLRDLGATHAQALIYWWQHETFGGDYWRGQYPEDHIGEVYLRKLDLFVDTAHELGIKPSFRLGSFREWNGRWHPVEEANSIEAYAEWIGRIATRYRGRIHHYVIGDEENKVFTPTGYDGSARAYMETFLVPVARAIRQADPDALISACAASSSPATDWQLDLIRLGLPRYADAIACNLVYQHLENPWEVQDLMDRARRAWPQVKFFANGVGYAENFHGLDDEHQAAQVAQAMFTLWEMGWDNAPYYLYQFSVTADTRQNFGIARFPDQNQPAAFSQAWYAYQAIAQTFYDRDRLTRPDFAIELEPADAVPTPDGGRILLAPSDPYVSAYVRQGDQLLIYLAYRDLRYPLRGRWNVVVRSSDWGRPQQIPLREYQHRLDLPSRAEGDRLIIPDILISEQPTIITLRRYDDAP